MCFKIYIFFRQQLYLWLYPSSWHNGPFINVLTLSCFFFPMLYGRVWNRCLVTLLCCSLYQRWEGTTPVLQPTRCQIRIRMWMWSQQLQYHLLLLQLVRPWLASSTTNNKDLHMSKYVSHDASCLDWWRQEYWISENINSKCFCITCYYCSIHLSKHWRSGFLRVWNM